MNKSLFFSNFTHGFVISNNEFKQIASNSVEYDHIKKVFEITNEGGGGFDYLYIKNIVLIPLPLSSDEYFKEKFQLSIDHGVNWYCSKMLLLEIHQEMDDSYLLGDVSKIALTNIMNKIKFRLIDQTPLN